jgi:hypothetical protein
MRCSSLPIHCYCVYLQKVNFSRIKKNKWDKKWVSTAMRKICGKPKDSGLPASYF